MAVAGPRPRTHGVTFDPNCPQCEDCEPRDSGTRRQDQHNIAAKLMRIFTSKKWSQKTTTQNNQIVFEKPLSFPKVKLRKTSNHPQVQSAIETESSGGGGGYLTRQAGILLSRAPLKISKSLPVRKPRPAIVWEEIQEFQKLLPAAERVSTVATQTDFSWLRHGAHRAHLGAALAADGGTQPTHGSTQSTHGSTPSYCSTLSSAQSTSSAQDIPDSNLRSQDTTGGSTLSTPECSHQSTCSTRSTRSTRPPLLTPPRPPPGVKAALRRVSLETSSARTRSSEEEEECNLEVWSSFCPRGSLASSSPSTAATRDVDGISSVIRSGIVEGSPV